MRPIAVTRRASGIVYHACFETGDRAASIAAITAAKLNPICVSEPLPAVLFGGRAVSFYVVVGMGLIEILEWPVSAPSPRDRRRVR